MAYTVLARRYRSAHFDELVGQEHIAQTLKKAISSGRIAHAFLFCGTRGTGKTSVARILAKALNCQSSTGPTPTPCGTCNSCLGIARGEDMDYVEIDAASNTQVDKTREAIIDNVAYRPARCRFKVFLIDEVHMLSKGSFNALLKTLEEPPEHVKFILATTEAEKLPNTILSRCQRYDFRNIPTREVAAHLNQICLKEGISADADALTLVARAGGGSMRDSLSLLDRLLSVGESSLTVAAIEALLGLPKAEQLSLLVDSLGTADAGAALRVADEILSSGLSPDGLIAGLVDHLHNLLLLRVCGEKSGLVEVPGVAMERLGEQARKMDTAILTQDIAMLEDLRRQLRSGAGGRALMDAVLVRLAMAEQFSSIAELLLDGPGPADEEKKNSLAGSRPARVPATGIEEDLDAMPEGALTRTINNLRSPPPPPLATPAPVSPAAAAPTMSAQEDDDDSLPAPGKVWETSGPSLGELLRQQQQRSAQTSRSAAEPVATNVEFVDEASLPTVWREVLEGFKRSAPSLGAMLDCTQLGSIDAGSAVVHFTSDRQFFAKMLEKEGRREKVAAALSTQLGKPVGLKFVVGRETESNGSSIDAPLPAAQATARLKNQREVLRTPVVSAAEAVAPVAPAATNILITEELLAELRQDELLGSVLTKLDAQIVKVLED